MDNAPIDLKLEAVIIPVADVERAKRFYESLGWRLDADFSNGTGWRGVQLTPPGSPCSIQFSTALTTAAQGPVQGLYLVVSDIDAARTALTGHGVDVSEVFHYDGFGGPRVPGPDAERRSYSSWATFSDPDGNSWLLQEVTTRFPGRGFSRDVDTLTALLRDAEERHGQYEPTAPKHHWSGWYAGYVVARERGRTVEEAVSDATRRVEGAGAPAPA